MNSGMQYYLATIIVYAAVYIIGAWGLNFQFGVAGVFNFGYILTIAAGAYVAGVVTLGAAPPGAAGAVGQAYVLGARLPYPLPLVAGALAGAVVGGGMGLVSLRRVRSDYQAVSTLIMSLIATDLVTNATGLFNGAQGIAGVPNPLAPVARNSLPLQQWLYVGLAVAVCIGCGVVMRRLMYSPLGRALRGMRDNPVALASLGRRTAWLRVMTFIVGGCFGGVSGALLIGFLGAWSPSAWLYEETFVLFTAIIVGGTGSFWGAAVGAVLLPVLFEQLPQFLPVFSANLVQGTAVQWIIIGLLAIGFLALRPQGAIPESMVVAGGTSLTRRFRWRQRMRGGTADSGTGGGRE